MVNQEMSTAPCPYCLMSGNKASKDHIFPQFLGGSRKIVCCKSCNEKFGQTFEAAASKTLHAQHLFISSWGVPLKSADAHWKNAFIHDDEAYNLSVGETGLILESAKPTIEFYDDGRLKKGKYRTREEAERAVQKLRDKGKTSETIRIDEIPPEKITFPLTSAFEIGPDLKRLALKMCIGLCTLLPDFHLDEVREARMYLNGDRRQVHVNNVFASFKTYTEINAQRVPLSHVIYVERGQSRINGIVQFFGVYQLFCYLGEKVGESPVSARLATLDPVSGKETFSEVPVINLQLPPLLYSPEEFKHLVGNWITKLGEEARKRGSNPSELNLSSLDFKTI